MSASYSPKILGGFYRIGMIGLGQMGGPMIRNVLAKKAVGEVYLYDAMRDNTERVRNEKGSVPVKVAQSVAEVAQNVDVILTMLPTPESVQEVCDTIFKNAKKQSLIIDCSTISPFVSKQLAERALAHDMSFVDSPVSGGVAGATAGSLTFMVGATADDFPRAQSLLSLMGKKIVHCGPAGSGSSVKLCNNLALAMQMIAVSEALNLGSHLGIDPRVLTEVMNSSTAACWSSTVNNPVPGIIANAPASRDYTGGFISSLMVKDLNLAVSAANQSGADVPLGKSALELYKQVVCKEGWDKKDFSVVYDFIAKGHAKGFHEK